MNNDSERVYLNNKYLKKVIRVFFNLAICRLEAEVKQQRIEEEERRVKED